MTIAVIGLGYIGLPTSFMMASSGLKVIGVDYDKKLVDSLKNGVLTFQEDGLEELFNRALDNGIEFVADYPAADMYIVAVPTPYDKASKKIDAKYIVSAINSILEVCSKGAIIVIESTISPGTISKYVRNIIAEKGLTIGSDIHLAHAPERIIPGNMIYELENNSRTIGADDKHIAERIKSVYQKFCKGEIVLTDIRTAEMSKVVENTYRDINIAFANELAKICRQDDMDVYEIIRIANKHPRVNILTPGPGVGGHCISVDPWFLVGDYPEQTKLIKQARLVNDHMPKYVFERLLKIMTDNGIADLSRVGLYGLTYKENVDDTRESPTLQLLEVIKNSGKAGIKVYDPFIVDQITENQYFNFDAFIADVDLVVIMVSHDHIKDNKDKIIGKVIFDTKKTFLDKQVNLI